MPGSSFCAMGRTNLSSSQMVQTVPATCPEYRTCPQPRMFRADKSPRRITERLTSPVKGLTAILCVLLVDQPQPNAAIFAALRQKRRLRQT